MAQKVKSNRLAARHVDAAKIIDAARLCAEAAVAGDALAAYRYVHAIVRIARIEISNSKGNGSDDPPL